jgi:hypothetical protein
MGIGAHGNARPHEGGLYPDRVDLGLPMLLHQPQKKGGGGRSAEPWWYLLNESIRVRSAISSTGSASLNIGWMCRISSRFQIQWILQFSPQHFFSWKMEAFTAIMRRSMNIFVCKESQLEEFVDEDISLFLQKKY